MNIKKIIKSIMRLGVISDIAYLAYKVGESSGEINERFRDKSEINVDDDFDYDEPDDGCIAPAENSTGFSFPEDNPEFAPLSSINVDGVSASEIESLLYDIALRKYISNKQVREWLAVDNDTAARVIKELSKAGYIGNESGNYRIPVYLTLSDFLKLKAEK